MCCSASRARTARCRRSRPSSSAPPGGPRSSRRPASPSRRPRRRRRALPRPAPSSSRSATPSGTHPDGPAAAIGPRWRRSLRRRRRPLMRGCGLAFGLRRSSPALAVGQPAGCGLERRVAPRRAASPISLTAPISAASTSPPSARRRARLDSDPDDAAAMTLLGELYNQGLGVRQDPQKAAEWYRLAAERGDAHALCALGHDGDRRAAAWPQDPASGKAWLEQAAAQGRAGARRYNLALLLLGDRDASRPRCAPSRCCGRRRRPRWPTRSMRSARCTCAGRGVAARHGRGGALVPAGAPRTATSAGEVEYAILLFNGDGVPETRPARRAIPHGRRAAATPSPRTASRGSMRSGRGVPKNLIEAAAWHLVASGRGLTDTWLDDALRDLSAEDRAPRPRTPRGRAARTLIMTERRRRIGAPCRLSSAPPVLSYSPLAHCALPRHDPLSPDDRDDRRRDQGGAVPEARLRRGREPAGVAQGPGRFRLRRRPPAPRRSCATRCEGAAGLRLPRWRRRASSRAPTRPTAGIVDPLDGTTNFLHGMPQFAISIGARARGPDASPASIYDPANDEMFIAESGKGAFLNDRRLRVAARRDLADALVACGMPHLGRGEHAALPQGARGRDRRRSRRHAPLRRGRARPRLCRGRARSTPTGSAASSRWDMAAGLILVREAGGFVTDADGGENLLAAGRSSAATRPCTASCWRCSRRRADADRLHARGFAASPAAMRGQFDRGRAPGRGAACRATAMPEPIDPSLTPAADLSWSGWSSS